MFLTDETIGPVELATELEARDIPALWVPEHPHIPVRRSTPVPSAYGGGELARMYLRLLDPIVALTAAATATQRLRVGTGISLLALRDPVVTAKEIATLDYLSGGRFEFGVGYGWNADEFPDHGQHFDERHAVVAEKVELMRRIWRDDVADYEGRHVRLEPSWAWPKPEQQPAPRIWLGGNGDRAMRAAAAWADVWFPTASAPDLATGIPRFRHMVEDAGRDPAEVGVAVAAAPSDGEFFAALVDLDVEEVSVVLPVSGRDDVLPAIDELVQMRDRLVPSTPDRTQS